MEFEPVKFLPQEQAHLLLPEGRFHFSKKIGFLLALSLIFITAVFHQVLVAPPHEFPKSSVVKVNRGETLSGVSNTLFEAKMVKSETAFKIFMVAIGGARGLVAGDYYFNDSVNALSLAWRLTHGSYNLQSVRVTVPEGLTAKQIADIISQNPSFSEFKPDEFVAITQPYEGYLFPDTYLFLPNVTAHDVMKIMLANYSKRIAEVENDITASKRTESDIIKMASILEEEGRTMTTREVIAGILWKRLDEKMPLQVDASVVYATGKKDGNALVSDDFKLDSPYNSYLYKGLPPTPISNPGLDAIRAATHPINSKYYFYITDEKGGFYPAATYEEHLINTDKYLR